MTDPTEQPASSDADASSGPSVRNEPAGLDDATIGAVGKLTEALETCEQARGHLYAFHQLTGVADFKVSDAVEQLRRAGHDAIADEIERDLVGRNVIADRWTFQIIEDYDATYWAEFRRVEKRARDELTDGQRHLHEARLKQDRRTHGHPDHAAGP